MWHVAVSHMSGVPFSSLCASLKCEMAHQKSEEKEEAGFNCSSRSKSPLQLPQRPAILLKPVQQTELPPRSVDVPRQGSELLLYLREASGGKLLLHISAYIAREYKRINRSRSTTPRIPGSLRIQSAAAKTVDSGCKTRYYI